MSISTSNSSAESILAAPSQAGGEALELVRALVRDKTRFEPGDLCYTGGADRTLAWRLVSRYTLQAQVYWEAIDGAHFVAAADDLRIGSVADVEAMAVASDGDRYAVAHALLREQLANPDQPYDTIVEGLYLGYQRRYWQLEQCGPCAGHGRVRCHGCQGRCTHPCASCHGKGRILCG